MKNNFPFWIASLVGRLLVLLIPIVALLYPVTRFLPALYDWLMQSKNGRLCRELRCLEYGIEAGDATNRTELVAWLDQLDKQADQLTTPVTYESMTYVLRNRIGIIRERLKAC